MSTRSSEQERVVLLVRSTSVNSTESDKEKEIN